MKPSKYTTCIVSVEQDQLMQRQVCEHMSKTGAAVDSRARVEPRIYRIEFVTKIPAEGVPTEGSTEDKCSMHNVRFR